MSGRNCLEVWIKTTEPRFICLEAVHIPSPSPTSGDSVIKSGGGSSSEKRYFWVWDLESISQTFYKQLLRTQIPKSAKKDSQVKQLFALLGSASVKAAHKHGDEIDPMLLAGKSPILTCGENWFFPLPKNPDTVSLWHVLSNKALVIGVNEVTGKTHWKIGNCCIDCIYKSSYLQLKPQMSWKSFSDCIETRDML